MKAFVLSLALALTSVPGIAQPAGRAEVLVLGVYHMANPGRDIVNMKADDVLAPRRQAEIAQLIAVLKNFHPTKIAVEADVYDKGIGKRYDEYVAGKHELSRNEVEQIGFRLAKELGHTTVYPTDVDGEFPFQRVVDYAKASGRSRELEAMMGEVGAMVKAQSDYLGSHTLLETLLYMNADDKVAGDIGLYYREAHFGEPGDWAGADLLSDWFRRNMHLLQSGAARGFSKRARARDLRCGASRLASPQCLERPHAEAAQARRIREVNISPRRRGRRRGQC